MMTCWDPSEDDAPALRRVEFCYIKYVVLHTTDEQIPLGLIHWDGESCLVTGLFENLSRCMSNQEGLLRRTVDALLDRAWVALGHAPRGAMGLADLFPVRKGFGASLYWTPVESADVADPVAHFNALRAAAQWTADDDEADTIVDIAPPVPSSHGGHVLPRSPDVEWDVVEVGNG